MDERMAGWEEAFRPIFEEMGKEARKDVARKYTRVVLEIRFGLPAAQEVEPALKHIENLERCHWSSRTIARSYQGFQHGRLGLFNRFHLRCKNHRRRQRRWYDQLLGLSDR